MVGRATVSITSRANICRSPPPSGQGSSPTKWNHPLPLGQGSTPSKSMLPPTLSIQEVGPPKSIRRSKKGGLGDMQQSLQRQMSQVEQHHLEAQTFMLSNSPANADTATASQGRKQFLRTHEDSLNLSDEELSHPTVVCVPTDINAVQQSMADKQAAAPGHLQVHSASGVETYGEGSHLPVNREAADDSSGYGNQGEVQPPSRLPYSRSRPSAATNLPFPDAAIGVRKRGVSRQVNRPLPDTDVAAHAHGERQLGPMLGRVAKRRRVVRAQGQSVPAGNMLQGVFQDGIAEPEFPPAGGDIQSRQAQPQHRARTSSGAQTNRITGSMSIDDLLQEVKNKAAFEVFAKERELEELRLEVGRLIQTVQDLEATIGTLEANKATLRDSLQQKCNTLAAKVTELLKDHKAIGPFINSTTAELSKWHRHREKAGSTFKDAITKYDAMTDQQRRMKETIRSIREEVAVEFGKLTSTHAQESEKIVAALQAEKRLVEAEKQKVVKLETCLNCEKTKVQELEIKLEAGTRDLDLRNDLKALFKGQQESLSEKVESHGQGILEAIDIKQEESATSLKDYLRTMQSHKEHESAVSKTLGEVVELITRLSSTVSDALKCRDGSDEEMASLHAADKEILDSIKEKVELMADTQTAQAKLTDRLMNLETAKARLEADAKIHAASQAHLSTQLQERKSELEEVRGELDSKIEEIRGLQSQLRQGAQAKQESDTLRSALSTASEEVTRLKALHQQSQENMVRLTSEISSVCGERDTAVEKSQVLEDSLQREVEKSKCVHSEKEKAARQAQNAEGNVVQLELQISEDKAATEKALEALRIKLEEEKRAAIAKMQLGHKGDVNLLKKRCDKLTAENTKLKEEVASTTTADSALQARIVSLEQGNAEVTARLAHHNKDYEQQRLRWKTTFQKQAHEISDIKATCKEYVSARAKEMQMVQEMEEKGNDLEAQLGIWEMQLTGYQQVEQQTRAYCSLNGISFSVKFPVMAQQIVEKARERPVYTSKETSTDSILLATSTCASQTYIEDIDFSEFLPEGQPSHDKPLHIAESVVAETIQIQGTPQRSQVSRHTNVKSSEVETPIVSPPKARRNQKIAQRRRSMALGSQASQGPAPARSAAPTPKVAFLGVNESPNLEQQQHSSYYRDEVPDSQETVARQDDERHSASARKGAADVQHTPSRRKSLLNRVANSSSPLTDVSEATINDGEAIRRKRSLSIVTGSQESQLKSILKKRTHLQVALEATPWEGEHIEETQLTSARKQLQLPKNRKTLASLGPGFLPSQEISVVTYGAPKRSVAEPAAHYPRVATRQPSNVSAQRNPWKRIQTTRGSASNDSSAPPSAAKQPRMSIPYKSSGSQ